MGEGNLCCHRERERAACRVWEGGESDSAGSVATLSIAFKRDGF